MGEHLSVTARSESGAIAEWKSLAEFRYQLDRQQRVGGRKCA
jgi:hypothetical protein